MRRLSGSDALFLSMETAAWHQHIAGLTILDASEAEDFSLEKAVGIIALPGAMVGLILAGVDPTTSCADGVGQGIYTREFSLKTYGAMLERAGDDLDRGVDAVVLDGSYHSLVERGRVREFAAQRGIPLVFIFCSCPEQEVRRRLEVRARDPEAVSDADWKIYTAQKSKFERPGELSAQELIELDTAEELEALLASLENRLAECRKS